ncbi:hypothetical protein WCLP8_220009 [uncultured Gammaproteobacteria bacterium]
MKYDITLKSLLMDGAPAFLTEKGFISQHTNHVHRFFLGAFCLFLLEQCLIFSHTTPLKRATKRATPSA